MHDRMPHLLLLRSAAVALAALLAACAPVTRKTAPPSAPVTVPAPADDLMAQLLSAQFALQNGDLATAAHDFTLAAALSPDAEVAEEATRLAMAVKDWPTAARALARWQELAPREPGVAQARAVLALGEGREAEAEAELSALAARSDDAGWRLVAQALLSGPDKAASARLLERLATPAHLGAQEGNWVAMSQLAFKLGDKALSQRLADRAVAKFHGGESYAWSARLAIDRGDKAAARAIYVEALRRDPRNPRLRGGYAALLAENGEYAAATRVFEQGPQDDLSYGARAAYAARADDKAALTRLYREMRADKGPRSGARAYLLGQVGESIGRREEALAWYREVSDEDEHWFDAQVRQAILLDQLGRDTQALDFLHELQSKAGSDGEQSRNAYLLEAELLARGQHERAALMVYERALLALPDDTRLLYARAMLQIELGDTPAAERDLRRINELKPDDAESMNALGYTMADAARDRNDPKLQEARELIRRAIELKPTEPAIIDSLGWLHYRMGNVDAALVQLRRAYEKQPEPDIAAHLGEVLWVKGERAEARRIWEEGRRKDPRNKILLETMRRLAP